MSRLSYISILALWPTYAKTYIQFTRLALTRPRGKSVSEIIVKA